MKIGKKSIKSKGLLLLLSLVLGLISLSSKPLQSEAYVGWPGILTENGRLPATPSEAEGSEVDFRDAFNLPGVFGGTTAQANHSYFSLERPNVVILYDGVNNDQKSMVWYTQKLSLNQPFEFESYVFLSNAAVQIGNLGVPDGMAFVMHNDPAGETAIGGTGGGLGVYPRASNLNNMIYNAVAVEFDTFANVNTETNTHYDQEFLDQGKVAWPHVAIGKTATSQDFGFGNTAIRDVMTNFKHIGPTVPASGEVADWFGVWKKVVVKWQPLPDKINGVLSYKFADYPEQSTTLDIDKTFNSTNWYNAERPIWDRKVTWGYTGSNGLKGNPFAAMITKLPQEPDVDVDRKVRNVTKGETEAEFRTNTVAHVGDILEYKVNVKNNVVEDLDISLKKTKVLESLEKNSYVTDSFAFSNSLSATPVAPTVTIDGDNNFTYVDSANEYPTGTSFEYTYRVTVGANTTEFINDVALSSTYSTRTQYGETTVNVLPEELKLVKTVNNAASVNPIVEDVLTVKVALEAERGVYMMDTLTDTVPTGFDIVPNSTYIYNEGAVGPDELLADASVWSGNTLTVKRVPDAWPVIGNPKNNKMIIEYKIKPTSAVKGKLVSLPTAVADGTNQYVDAKDKQDYQVVSNNATVKVKTDVIVSFKNMDSSLLEASKIISTNADFNKKNPVTLYYNTGDSFDLSTVIDEISGHIFTNDQLTKVSVEGDIVEDDLAEAGAVINVLYSAKTTLTINFINEVGAELHAPIVQEHNIGDFVDLQTDQDVRDAIAAIEASQYVLDERPDDEDNIEIVVNGTEVTYKFIGTLSIHSAPDVINFGDQKVGMFGTKVREPEYDNPFVIWDNRAGLGSWTLTAKLETPLTNLDDDTKVLVDAIRYQVTEDEASEITLNDQSQDIAIRNHPTAGEYVLSDEWSADGKGFKLEVPAGAVRKLGKYQATILWKLGATP